MSCLLRCEDFPQSSRNTKYSGCVGTACPFAVKGLAMRCAIVNGVLIVAQGNFSRAVRVSCLQYLSETVQLPCWTGDSEEYSRQSRP